MNEHLNIVVVGYGMEGKSSYDYFTARGHTVTISDQSTDITLPTGALSQLGGAYLDNLDTFDVIVRTAGMHPKVILEKNPSVASKITTQLNEFLRVCPTKNTIGVTGTKGKGTTSTLITKILEAAGKEVFLGGNIGVPLLSLVDNISEDSWMVLELSSFQLMDVQYSPHIGVCVMVVPEHLNWHADMAEYLEAKSHLFARQTPEDVAIYYAENAHSKQIARAGQGQKITYYASPGAIVKDGAIWIDNNEICKTSELKLLGAHNWQNVCAAVTATWQVTQDVAVIRSAVISFSGLPHRIEFLRELNGVRYFNDSFATGLHATEAAILAIPGKKVVILGGFERMLPLEHFTQFATEHSDEFEIALLIGASAERLAAALQTAGFTNYVVDTSVKDMPAIVARAQSLAKPGNAILLSPGFASYDMFKNFEVRGQEFQAIVKAL